MSEGNQNRYDVSADAYLKRCLDLLENPRIETLFYAAFELRCAIERQVFDLFALLLETSGSDPMKVMEKGKMYKPRDFVAEMRRYDPLFEKKLRFVQVVARREGLIKGGRCFDPDWLCKTHDGLNELLHHQKNPELNVWKPKWSDAVFAKIKSQSETLFEMMESNRGFPRKFNLAGQVVWDRFAKEDLTDEQLWRLLEIADPRPFRKIPIFNP